MQPAGAALMLFQDIDAFQTTAGPFQVEEFETSFDDAGRIEFEGFEVREQSFAARLSSRTDYVGSGQRALGFTWNGQGEVEWHFDPPILAYGVSILDFGTCCGATALTATLGPSGEEVVAARGSDLPRGNQQFFGFTSLEPISSLSFRSDSVSRNDLIIFDDLYYQPVPEPTGTGFLLAISLPAIGALRRYRGSRRANGARRL
jgi:hypothetical protein